MVEWLIRLMALVRPRTRIFGGFRSSPSFCFHTLSIPLYHHCFYQHRRYLVLLENLLSEPEQEDIFGYCKAHYLREIFNRR